MHQKLSTWWNVRLEAFRHHLARPDALIQLTLMGLLTGLLAGAVIVLFRLLVEGAQAGFLPGSDHENFEALPLWAVFLLPVSGGIALAVVFRWWAQNSHVLGVARLMERMAYHQGYLSVREFFLQFIGAALAIASGHSVGREGPHIFLGAASGSLLGQFLALPNNSIRTMAACGTAAGIAASFNTPLAGVIFALEVVMLEYTLASFVPVMIAATSATAVSVFVFGSAPAFLIPQLQLGSLAEMPLLLVLGVVIGTVAALFVHLLEVLAARVQAIAFWWRVSLAGLFMGLVGMVVPEVMGIGYDTVNAVLMGQVGMGMLAVIVFTKLIATVVCVGMGVPGGMISPSLFMGAVLGSLTGLVIHGILPESGIDAGVYALLGMGAMMGATLQAPLAALTAMMELTYSPQIIMPGMLVVVVACLTASEIFRKESLFITMLKANGMDYNTNPVMQSLRRMGVASVMDKAYARTDRMVKRGQAEQLLADEPDWILVEESREPISLMRAMDLARHLGAGTGQEEKTAPLDLMGIPAHRSDIASIHIQATLQEAWDKLEAASVEALFVERTNAAGKQRIFGVVTRETLESAYRY